MSSILPITVEDFKAYFCKDNGFVFQPYPTWVRTAFDAGEYCLYDGVFYQSTMSRNVTSPANIDPDDPEWYVASTVYVEGSEYTVGDVVGYEGKFYTPKETTTELPTDKDFWDELSEEELLERFPEYRVWKQPTVYSEGDKVIGMVNYKLGVYQSTIDDNAYGLTDIYSDTPIEQRAWELLEDEEVDWILDSDIERAMGEAMFKFNASLVPNEEKRKIIALYLTAFFIAYDRQMSNAGLNSNSSSGPVRSRTVGKMSVSYMESTLYSRHPAYEFFSRNMYGIKAFNLLLPYLRGNVLVLRGGVSAE